MKKNIVFKIGDRYLRWHLGEFDYYNAMTFAQEESKEDYIGYMRICLWFPSMAQATKILCDEEEDIENKEISLMKYIPQPYDKVKKKAHHLPYIVEFDFPDKVKIKDLKNHFEKVFEEKVEIELI